MMPTKTHTRPRSGLPAISCCSLLALASLLTPATPARAAEPGKEIVVKATQVQTHRIIWNPRATGAPSSSFASRGPGCPQVTASVTNNFNNIDVGAEITLQAGMVQGEGFGSTYTVVDPNPGTTTINEAFPIEVNLVEFFAGTAATVSGSTGENVRLGWSIEVWDGEPNVGTSAIAFSVESDPDPTSTGLPGDLMLQRVSGATCDPIEVLLGGASASAAKVQFSVDQTADINDRMFVQGNATNDAGVRLNTFTVVVRIMHHNVPGAGACSSVNLCNNAFLATEGAAGNTLNFSSRNWLLAANCPTGAPAGYNRFSALSSTYRPTRDVVQQMTYTPAACAGVITGACCSASGGCSSVSQAACTGTYQGDSTLCNPNPCPQPTGACCTAGACTTGPSAACSGTYQGNNTTCGTVTCPQPTGACCFGTGCLAATSADCSGAGGVFQGTTSACAASACPSGACCIVNTGACSTASPAACTTLGGQFRGNGVACSTTSCPPPTGACCATNGFCLSNQTQTDCTSAGLSWRGGGSVCQPNPCAPSTGLCCRGTVCSSAIAQAACSATAPVGALFVSTGTCNAVATATSPCCFADFNKESGISVQDIFDYLNSWFAVSPYCRINGDGTAAPTVEDIFSFLNVWLAGGC